MGDISWSKAAWEPCEVVRSDANNERLFAFMQDARCLPCSRLLDRSLDRGGASCRDAPSSPAPLSAGERPVFQLRDECSGRYCPGRCEPAWVARRSRRRDQGSKKHHSATGKESQRRDRTSGHVRLHVGAMSPIGRVPRPGRPVARGAAAAAAARVARVGGAKRDRHCSVPSRAAGTLAR